jgi:hypothetical protein
MDKGRSLLLVLVLVGVLAPPALAKDLCIEIENGIFPGSIYVLKKVSLGAEKVSPVHGYWAKFELGFQARHPVQGQAISSSARTLIVGLTGHNIGINTDASGLLLPGSFDVSLRCLPGADGKIGVEDACDGRESGAVTGRVVSCKSAPGIP